jgi:hypothetical protein
MVSTNSTVACCNYRYLYLFLGYTFLHVDARRFLTKYCAADNLAELDIICTIRAYSSIGIPASRYTYRNI